MPTNIFITQKGVLIILSPMSPVLSANPTPYISTPPMKAMIMQMAESLAEKAGFRARFRTIARSNAVDRITTATLVIGPSSF